jgi:hypothetical protein
MYREEYYPQFVDSLGPIRWTPCDVANPTELSQTVWIFDSSQDKVRPASKREKSDGILLGLNGSTPAPFTISWKEVSDDIDAHFLSEFTTTVTASALTVADVLRAFNAAYVACKTLPPAGMTLRWFLTDVMNRGLRIEFKTHAESLSEEAEIDAFTAPPPSYTEAATHDCLPLVPGGPATVQRV